MPRNTAAGKAAIGPLNTSDGETITVLTSKAELMAAKRSFTNFFSPVRPHLCDAARWIKLRPNRWIVSATSKRLCRGVDRTGESGSFTRVEPHRYNQPVPNIRD